MNDQLHQFERRLYIKCQQRLLRPLSLQHRIYFWPVSPSRLAKSPLLRRVLQYCYPSAVFCQTSHSEDIQLPVDQRNRLVSDLQFRAYNIHIATRGSSVLEKKLRQIKGVTSNFDSSPANVHLSMPRMSTSRDSASSSSTGQDLVIDRGYLWSETQHQDLRAATFTSTLEIRVRSSRKLENGAVCTRKNPTTNR